MIEENKRKLNKDKASKLAKAGTERKKRKDYRQKPEESREKACGEEQNSALCEKW